MAGGLEDLAAAGLAGMTGAAGSRPFKMNSLGRGQTPDHAPQLEQGLGDARHLEFRKWLKLLIGHR